MRFIDGEYSEKRKQLKRLLILHLVLWVSLRASIVRIHTFRSDEEELGLVNFSVLGKAFAKSERLLSNLV
ncbi:MAG: hypothetical protein JXB24_13150 [Bacteroidales bacterium]|nr:hypothetical protein [Bacteroidales bacterium]